MRSAALHRRSPKRCARSSREHRFLPLAALVALLLTAAPGSALAVRTAEQARQEAGRLKNEGVRAYEAGRLSEAATKLRQTIDINLTDFFAHFYLGLALRDRREYVAAREVLEVAAELDPRYLQVYVALGEVALGQGDPGAARAWFQKALNRQANYAPALDGMGVLAEARGKTDQAVDHYRQAIEANRGFPLPYVHLGEVYRRQGRIDDAIALFKEAIRFRPDFAEGYRFLGVAYGELGRRTESTSLLEKAVELEPENPGPVLDLARLFAQWDDRVQARARFRTTLVLDPESVGARLGLADLSRRDGDHAEGIRILEEALALPRLDPQVETEIATLRAQYRNEAARFKRAQAAIEIACCSADVIDGGHAEGEARLRMARLLEDAGDAPGADRSCRASLDLLGRPPEALFECGYLALQAGIHGEATLLLEEALAARPEMDRAWVDLGLALAGVGRLTSALGAYNRALEIEPSSLEAHLYLGNAHYRLGQMQQAEEIYRKALRIAALPETIDRLNKVLLHIEDMRLARQAKQDAAGEPESAAPAEEGR